MFSKFAIASILALASAAPFALPGGDHDHDGDWYSLDQFARFDNAEGTPLVAVAPINIYLDLLWNGMSLAETPGLTNALGVLPQSPNNFAAYSALDVATVKQGQPAMTVKYQDSTVDHFDLHSFYYGCALAAQTSAVGVPTSCTVTVKGYSDAEAKDQVAYDEFKFEVAPLQTSVQMNKAELGEDFEGVKRVEFFVSDPLLTAALIDSVSYTVYSEQKW